MVLRQNGSNYDILARYDYEPFGKRISVDATTGRERLSFIGKEKDLENNLGDFGVRKYDEDIGRFTSIDPLFEKYYGWSPYHYCGNNPVNRLDPSGMAYFYNESGLVHDDGVNDGLRFAIPSGKNISDYSNKDGIINYMLLKEESFIFPSDNSIKGIMDNAYDKAVHPALPNAEAGGAVGMNWNAGNYFDIYFDGGVNTNKPENDNYGGEATEQVKKGMALATAAGFAILYKVHTHPFTKDGIIAPSPQDQAGAATHPGIVLNNAGVVFYNQFRTAKIPIEVFNEIRRNIKK